MKAALKAQVAACVAEATGSPFALSECVPQGGGCINEAFIVGDGRRRFFVKTNHADRAGMFRAEAEALRVLAQAGAVRVPEPVAEGVGGGRAFLVLEAIEFGPAGDWQEAGRALAALHRATGPSFGWEHDNTIGSTPQRNGWSGDWAVFYRDHRLRPQFELAGRNGLGLGATEALLEGVPELLAGHEPVPSLLHGDLWPGNAAFDGSGRFVIFDPASYYGDRETDLAFSECFGGFPPAFYEGYGSAWPPGTGYAERRELYNLYHILNHANLFGGGYAGQAAGMIRGLVRRLA